MLEVEALQFTNTFKTYNDFRSEEKNTLLDKYSALLGVSTSDDFESIYKDTYDYVMQTIYNYYDCYYLTSATKDRFLTLLGTILSGKLPNYKVKYDNYLDARNQAYNTLGGRKTSSSGSGSGSSSGGQKFANTPEVINSGVDYVDQYSTSENKYNNARNDNYSKQYEETLKASAKQIWENVKSIPDDIYKEVITITAKLFFSETMEEKQYPIAYLTLTRRVQELGASVISSLDTQLNTDYELVTTLVTEGGTFNASADLKSIIFKELTTEYDPETHKVQTTWSFRNGMSAVDTYTLPMSGINTDGLMSAEQFSKLDQVVLYGTNFASQGEQYAVRQDADHDLYVVVPKGEVAIASKDETGVVQLYANQLTTEVETTLFTDGTNVPVQMEKRNKLFVNVPVTKVDNLSTKLNAKDEVEVITDGETIRVGENGLETINKGLEETGNTQVSLWVMKSLDSAYSKEALTNAQTIYDTYNNFSIFEISNNTITIINTGYNNTDFNTGLNEMPIEDFVLVMFSGTGSNNVTSFYLYYTENRLFLKYTADGITKTIECDPTSITYYLNIQSSTYMTYRHFTGIKVKSLSDIENVSYTNQEIEGSVFYHFLPTTYKYYNTGASYETPAIVSGYRYDYFTSDTQLIYRVAKPKTYFES